MSAQGSFVTIQVHAEQARDALGGQIIEGMGGPGDVVELFGPEGAAKTRLALSAARAIIGEPTWGPFRINRNGSVLLLYNPGFFVDLGVAYQGAPELELDPFGNATALPGFNANLETERQDIEDALGKYFRFYPVISLGFSIGF